MRVIQMHEIISRAVELEGKPAIYIGDFPASLEDTPPFIDKIAKACALFKDNFPHLYPNWYLYPATLMFFDTQEEMEDVFNKVFQHPDIVGSDLFAISYNMLGEGMNENTK